MAKTTVNRQERKAKADKKAKVKADEIVAAATEAVVTKSRKRGEVTAEEQALSDQVKALRDGGMAWWKIGHTLGLPGSADNVAQGKGGASRARGLYKKGHGDYAKVQRMRRGPDETMTSANGTRRRNNRGHEVVTALPGTSIFNPEQHDDEIIEAIAGKKITWDWYSFNVETGQHDHYEGTQSATVHERCRILLEPAHDGHGLAEGDRYLHFRMAQESSKGLPPEYLGQPSMYRAIRLSYIVKVEGTGRRYQPRLTEEELTETPKAKRRARRQARKETAS